MTLLFLVPLATMSQAEKDSFRIADSVTYAQYLESDWKALIRSGKNALRNGHDYYYLRVRMGVAYFERRNYLQAINQFREALKMNSGDPFAGEYLYGCYLNMNMPAEALKAYEELPASLKEKLSGTLPKLHHADLFGGFLASDQPQKFDQLDLDGDSSYYGEVDMARGGTNFSAGVSWDFKDGTGIYGGYSWIRLDKNKLAQAGDTILLDDQYQLDQHQCYIAVKIPVGKNFLITPAFNYILDNFETSVPVYDQDSNSYRFPVTSTRLQAVIGYLSVTRDFQVVRTSLFGAWSNLNDREQVQAGFHLVAFPKGNLDFYLSSKLLDHIVDGNHHFIFEQMIGAKIFGPLWAEVNATFGEMIDYHENNAFVVYNFADRMKFKAGGKLIWTISPRVSLSGEYIFIQRNGDYTVYENAGTSDELNIVPVSVSESFYNHIAVLGLTWKF